MLRIVRQAELAQAGEWGGERFVDLDEIEVADLEPEALHPLAVDGTGPIPMIRGGTADAMPARARA